MGVLKIRSGVAFEGDHAIEVEHVIPRRITREIRVFDRRDPDRTSDRREFALREPMGRCVRFGGPDRHRFGASINRGLQKVHQFEVGAGSCLEGFLVRTEDSAESEMDEFGFHAVGERGPADLPAGIEDVSEMIALASVDHVDDLIAIEFLHPIPEGREISGRVEKTSVSLPNQHGAFAVFETNHERAVVLDREFGADEGIDDFGKFVAKT